MNIIADLSTVYPATLLALGGLIILMIEAFAPSHKSIYWVSLITLLGAFAATMMDLNVAPGISFNGMVAYGGAASFGTLIVVIGTFFTLVLSKDYLEGISEDMGEVMMLIVFAAFGMVVLAQSNDLITVFMGVETMSICLYVLAGLFRDDKKGAEAALKYFLLGAFSTGFFLYGIALLYGATGTTNLYAIAQASDMGLLYWAGVSLLFVGFLFKVSAVPFHMWTPDVYQGAPTTVTGFMATASKAATFVALILVVTRALPEAAGNLSKMLSVMAILTMVFGNLIAIVQDNVKRMLAYSSIAHAGYALVGFVAATPDGYSAVLYYLFAYTIMNIGAFGVLAYYEKHSGLDFTHIENLAGLGFKQPIMGVMLSIFLFSLAGIPPLIGFYGKYFVFASAISQGYITLAIIGVLASAASVYYYLRVMVYLYFKASKAEVALSSPGALYQVALILLTLFTIYFGVVPTELSSFISSFSWGSELASLITK